jgi:flagellum-specific peptidoglycan hydrolase FlgJ
MELESLNLTEFFSSAVKEKTKKFIEDYGVGIAKSIADTELFFPAVIAQSCLESGYGQSGLTKEANNFGGIKYNPNLEGVIGFVVKDTSEYVNGVKRNMQQKFSKFKDVESGFKAHIKVLMSERYKNARLNAKTPEEQILMIAKAGYTTTPPNAYLKGLQSIINASRSLSELGRISTKAETQKSGESGFWNNIFNFGAK